jgi:hypothetical protein
VNFPQFPQMRKVLGMRTTPVLLSRTLLIAMLLVPDMARSQVQASTTDCPQDAACLALMEQAAERSKSSDLPEALRLYKLAYELRSDPRLLFNIARSLHKQGKLSEALQYYERFISAPVQDEGQQQKAREYVELIRATSATLATDQPAARGSAEAVPRPPSHVGKPIYKKWWFWTILGTVVAAGIGGGVAGGIVSSPRLPEPILRPF